MRPAPERLVRWRESMGWSQTDLAHELKTHPAVVSRIENGKRLPTLEQAILIEKLCKISPKRWHRSK